MLLMNDIDVFNPLISETLNYVNINKTGKHCCCCDRFIKYIQKKKKNKR